MSYCFTGVCLNSIFSQALTIASNAFRNDRLQVSRNGLVWVFPGVTVIDNLHPQRCQLLSVRRNANPFFHVMEGIWMLAGRNDVAWLAQFNKRMTEFSDDGVTFNGAYGYRWRRHFHYDQIVQAIEMLREDPATRRVAISMWDGHRDLGLDSKDIPCNLLVVPQLDQPTGSLNMTVFNRSNDLFWGMLGANAVHFSFLHQFLSTATGLPLGRMFQVSSNAHIYLEKFPEDTWETMSAEAESRVAESTMCERVRLVNQNWRTWLEEASLFVEDVPFNSDDYFFSTVAMPMRELWENRKKRDEWQHRLQLISDDAWRIACSDWLYTNVKEEQK